MPFPAVKESPEPPIQPEYAAIGDEDASNKLDSAIGRVMNKLGVPARRPLRAASVVYLGLCRLKHFTDQDSTETGQRLCREILTEYKPGAGAYSVNCSFFTKPEKSDKWVDHEDAIDRACGVYIPRLKSRKKLCFTLLVLGSRHTDQISLPDDDKWLITYDF